MVNLISGLEIILFNFANKINDLVLISKFTLIQHYIHFYNSCDPLPKSKRNNRQRNLKAPSKKLNEPINYGICN